MAIEETLVKFEALLEEIRDRVARLEDKLKPEPTCFRFDEAAKRLGVSESTLRRMVRAKEIRPSKVGKVPMISLAEIQRVSTPEPERLKVEAAQRAAAWVPIPRKRRKA